MKSINKPLLVIEDDKVDVMTIKRALKVIDVSNPVVHRENGEDALTYLRDPDLEKPCVILLDLNMPVMNGVEFLQVIKRDDLLKRLPVIVLTTSEEPQDKLNSFNLGVAAYMTKPVVYRQFVELMRSIARYWASSELP